MHHACVRDGSIVESQQLKLSKLGDLFKVAVGNGRFHEIKGLEVRVGSQRRQELSRTNTTETHFANVLRPGTSLLLHLLLKYQHDLGIGKSRIGLQKPSPIRSAASQTNKVKHVQMQVRRPQFPIVEDVEQNGSFC